eukprot:241005_1
MGKSMSIISAITLLSVANWSTVSCDMVGQLFDSIDINKKDGQISTKELLAAAVLSGEDTSASEWIALKDLNNDGTLDLHEFSIIMSNYKSFKGVDKDGNEKLTIAEIGSALPGVMDQGNSQLAEFTRVDLDKSGSLDFLEFVKITGKAPDAEAKKLKKDSSSGVLVSASLSCLFIILLQLF